MALPGYDRQESLPNGWIAYVRKGVTDTKSAYEFWYGPELGNVIVGLMERPAGADFKIVRRTLSIERGNEKDAQIDVTQYRRSKDLTFGLRP